MIELAEDWDEENGRELYRFPDVSALQASAGVCLCGQTDEDMTWSCPLYDDKERHVERNKGAASGPGILCGSRGYTGELRRFVEYAAYGRGGQSSIGDEEKPEERRTARQRSPYLGYKPIKGELLGTRN
ncbi:hypothetical protein EVAR_89973_1 [Eumeta japonica]|uniref:Uncharacterized protein n=1 Tax=Eumeta variegata TaxID=151549 RepID=A0A4C2A8J0_EUMVA|nr:hypothetical protein EVAR_89973_1 [Eumeta japonica]